MKRPHRVFFTDDERVIVRAAVAGHIGLEAMFDAMPHRAIGDVCREFRGIDCPAEEEKHLRSCLVGSKGLELAIKRYVAPQC